MKRKGSLDGKEVPSLIQEIVIYDKPNKPLVPSEILPDQSGLALAKGDIVLSRGKDVDQEESSSSKGKPENSGSSGHQTVKSEPSESEEESDEYITKNLGIVAFENEKELNLVAASSSEEEESIENISKEINKSFAKSSPEAKPKKVVHKKIPKENENSPKSTPKKRHAVDSKTSKSASKEESATPFKRPRGRPRKSISHPIPEQNKKPTILNYLIHGAASPTDPNMFEDDSKIIEECNDIIQDTLSSTVSTTIVDEVRQKRVRRVPKKYDNDEILMEGESLGHYSRVSETPSPNKKKKYTELKVVRLPSAPIAGKSTDNLDELLNEAQEQVRTLNDAEDELQTFVKSGLADKFVKIVSKKNLPKIGKKTDKNAKSARKSDNIEKNIKKQTVENSKVNDLLDMSHEEAYFQTDEEDSRTEWIPEELARYKQEHLMKIITKMHKCKFCELEFGSYYGLRKHRALEHDDLGRDTKESAFNDSQEEAVEIRDDGDEREDDESDDESRGEWMPEDYAEYKMKHNINKIKRLKWYKCKICCAMFSNYYKLSKHRLEHENKSDPYECKQCEFKCNTVETLQAHLRTHQGKDPYNCQKCGKGFSTKEDLDQHMSVHILKKVVPIPAKRFRCDLCGREFNKLCDVERHTRVHTGEKPCECNICHKRFQQAHNLSKHLLTHLHLKPFECEICNKKFGRIDVLNRHILTHSMEKPFKCTLCNKGFIRQSQLSNHLDKFHQDDMSFQITDEVDVVPVV